MANVTVIILTLNEELNLPYALNSIKGFTDDICVVDSGSTDNTENIAKDYAARFFTNPWPGWGEQRNWSIQKCNLKYEWVLFLDADEQLTCESKSEIEKVIQDESDHVGFYLSFDYYFLGKKLNRVMKPHFRLIKKGFIEWETIGAREICNIPDNASHVKAKLLHKDNRGLKKWLEKQSRNAFLDAKMIYEIRNKHDFDISSISKYKLLYYRKCPLLLMPLTSFMHKLFFSFSLKNSFINLLYITILSIWYQLLVVLYYYEFVCLNDKDDKA